jgi:hypothetical protein
LADASNRITPDGVFWMHQVDTGERVEFAHSDAPAVFNPS